MKDSQVFHALDWASRGHPVLPGDAKTHKPLTPNGIADASTDPDAIKEWWKTWPEAVPLALQKPFGAKPFTLRDPSLIPRRQWLYPRTFVRRQLTVTVAPGGLGKSSESIVNALAMATGRDLLNEGFKGPPLRVWLWNGEDPIDELERRIAAACLHYGITNEDIGGRLHVDSGHDKPIQVAFCDKAGPQLSERSLRTITETIVDQGIDVATFDPLVTVHRVPENSTEGMEIVAAALARIAVDCDCAIHAVHHTRKQAAGTSGETTAEDARGAIALVAKARVVRVLNGMTKEEAERAGIEEGERRRHFRIGADKMNLMPPDQDRTWRYLASVELPNGEGDPDNPFRNGRLAPGSHVRGDNVGVVTPWTWPNPLDDVTVRDLRAVQHKIASGEWRGSDQTPDWAGKAVAEVLGIDVSDKAAKAKVKGLLKVWIANKALKIVQKRDGRSKPRPFVEVNEWVRD